MHCTHEQERLMACTGECQTGFWHKVVFARDGYSNAGKESYPQDSSYFPHKKLLANVDNLGIGNRFEKTYYREGNVIFLRVDAYVLRRYGSIKNMPKSIFNPI